MLTFAAPYTASSIDGAWRVQQTGDRVPENGYRGRLLIMGTYPPPGPGARVGHRIDEAIELIEMELRHAIAYVNDAVIPQVRTESITAMRTVADTLRNLADRFEERGNTPKDPRT